MLGNKRTKRKHEACPFIPSMQHIFKYKKVGNIFICEFFNLLIKLMAINLKNKVTIIIIVMSNSTKLLSSTVMVTVVETVLVMKE